MAPVDWVQVIKDIHAGEYWDIECIGQLNAVLTKMAEGLEVMANHPGLGAGTGDAFCAAVTKIALLRREQAKAVAIIRQGVALANEARQDADVCLTRIGHIKADPVEYSGWWSHVEDNINPFDHTIADAQRDADRAAQQDAARAEFVNTLCPKFNSAYDLIKSGIGAIPTGQIRPAMPEPVSYVEDDEHWVGPSRRVPWTPGLPPVAGDRSSIGYDGPVVTVGLDGRPLHGLADSVLATGALPGGIKPAHGIVAIGGDPSLVPHTSGALKGVTVLGAPGTGGVRPLLYQGAGGPSLRSLAPARTAPVSRWNGSLGITTRPATGSTVVGTTGPFGQGAVMPPGGQGAGAGTDARRGKSRPWRAPREKAKPTPGRVGVTRFAQGSQLEKAYLEEQRKIEEGFKRNGYSPLKTRRDGSQYRIHTLIDPVTGKKTENIIDYSDDPGRPAPGARAGHR